MRAGFGAAGSVPLQKVVAAVNLAESIRRYGHLAAQLDPLGGKPPGDPSLQTATHGLTDDDLRALPAALVSWCSRRSRPDGFRRHRRLEAPLLRNLGLRHLARVRAGRARLAAAGRRGRPLPRPGGSDSSRKAAGPPVPGRGVRALPAAHLSGQNTVLDRRPGHARPGAGRGDRRSRRVGHPQHPDRDGASRPAERDGARAEQAVRADPGRVQGAGVAELPRGHVVDRRREVPRRRAAGDPRWRTAGRRGLDAAEPEPPRGGRSGGRGHGPRGRHDCRRRRPAALRSGPQRTDPDPWRRRVPGAGRGRGDAEPEPLARLFDGRHDPRDRQ